MYAFVYCKLLQRQPKWWESIETSANKRVSVVTQPQLLRTFSVLTVVVSLCHYVQVNYVPLDTPNLEYSNYLECFFYT